MTNVTIPLPEYIGPQSGANRDGVILGGVDRQFPAASILRSSVYGGGRFFTIDATTGGDVIADVSAAALDAASADVPMFPASPTAGDAFEFALTKADWDAGRRVVVALGTHPRQAMAEMPRMAVAGAGMATAL